MNDKSEFVLRLIDRITGPARQMRRALRGLRTEATHTLRAVERIREVSAGAGLSLRRAGIDAAQGARKFEQAARAIDRATAGRARVLARAAGIREIGLTASIARLRAQGVPRPVARGPGLFERAGNSIRDLFRWNSAAGESIAKWRELSSVFMGTPFGFVIGGLGKIGGALFDVVKYASQAALKVGGLVGGVTALAGVGLTKLVGGMAAFAESTTMALGNVIGDKGLGGAAFEHGRKLAGELGMDVEETVKGMLKLRAMQFSIREATDLMRLSADLQTITGDAEGAKRALTAITQIKAKGRLQSEELVGQLAEAGVSTVMVYKQLEKQLGISRQGVLKQLQAGAIDADTGIKAIRGAILEKLGIGEAGQAGRQFANETLTGLWNSLKAAPKQFALNVAEFVDLKPLKRSIREVLGADVDHASIGRFVDEMIIGLSKLLPAAVEFGRGFTTSLDGITDALGFSKMNLREHAFEAGKSFGEFAEHAIKMAKRLLKIAKPAFESFMEGLDINGLLKDLEGANWKQIGADMRVVAGALGSIVHDVASVARVFGGDSGKITRLDDAGIKQLKANFHKLDPVDQLIAKGVFGVEPEPSQPPPSPRAVRDGSRETPASKVEANGWYFNIQGGRDPEETAERVRSKLTTALETLTQRSMVHSP